MGQALIEATLADPRALARRGVRRRRQPGGGSRRRRAVRPCDRRGRSAPTSMPRPRAADVLIDFTRPEGTLAHLAACARHGTGRGRRHDRTLGRAEGRSSPSTAQPRFPIVFAPNMSVGVNVLLALVEDRGAATRPRVRHRDRRDAPQAQGRRAVRHRARSRRGGGAGGRHGARGLRGLRAPGRDRRAQAAAPSASRACGAATSSASTR